MAQDTIVSFDSVSFEFENEHKILEEASFSIRSESKITVMGQNGAGKSTIFKLICGKIKPTSGNVNIVPGLSIAIAPQVTPPEDRELTVKAFFEKYFQQKAYDIERKISDVLEIVNLHAPLDRIIKSFSGGQQARLLLASALIQDPDLLLLDEPTNHLDIESVESLIKALQDYQGTLLFVTHDRYFASKIATRVIALTEKGIKDFHGSYSEYIERYGDDYLSSTWLKKNQ